MVETVCFAGCTCIFCIKRSDAGAETNNARNTPRSRSRRHIRCLLPSTSSVMEVLYPPSYLGTPPAFSDPPLYFPGDTHPPAARGDDRERIGHTPLVSSTISATGRALVPSGHHDPLVGVPSVTGIPSPGVPSGRVPAAEPNAPVVGLGIDVLERAEPLPAYSRFDGSPSHLPVVSDVLGPYPHISVLNPPAWWRG